MATYMPYEYNLHPVGWLAERIPNSILSCARHYYALE